MSGASSTPPVTISTNGVRTLDARPSRPDAGRRNAASGARRPAHTVPVASVVGGDEAIEQLARRRPVAAGGRVRSARSSSKRASAAASSSASNSSARLNRPSRDRRDDDADRTPSLPRRRAAWPWPPKRTTMRSSSPASTSNRDLHVRRDLDPRAVDVRDRRRARAAAPIRARGGRPPRSPRVAVAERLPVAGVHEPQMRARRARARSARRSPRSARGRRRRRRRRRARST